MPNPDGSIDTSKWRLQTLSNDPYMVNDPNSIFFGMGGLGTGSGTYGSWGIGAQGSAAPIIPFQSAPQPNWGAIPQSRAPFQSAPQPNYGAIPQARVPFVGNSSGLKYGTTDTQITSYSGSPDLYYGEPVKDWKSPGNGGNAGNSSMSAGEKRWADIAAKMGLNWQVTKDVYMNPHRNGSPNPAEALGRQMDDKIWGDVFMQATGHAPNQQEWIDHYNAGGNWAYDPLTGHNDAIAEIERRRAELEAQTNPQDYPDWYQPPQ